MNVIDCNLAIKQSVNKVEEELIGFYCEVKNLNVNKQIEVLDEIKKKIDGVIDDYEKELLEEHGLYRCEKCGEIFEERKEECEIIGYVKYKNGKVKKVLQSFDECPNGCKSIKKEFEGSIVNEKELIKEVEKVIEEKRMEDSDLTIEIDEKDYYVSEESLEDFIKKQID